MEARIIKWSDSKPTSFPIMVYDNLGYHRFEKTFSKNGPSVKAEK